MYMYKTIIICILQVVRRPSSVVGRLSSVVVRRLSSSVVRPWSVVACRPTSSIFCPSSSVRRRTMKLCKGFFFVSKIVTFFPGGSQKRKSDNDDKHSPGQEKRRPSTYVRGASSV